MKIVLIVIFTAFINLSCKKKSELKGINFRQEMVQFVSEISSYAKSKNANFLIIPQNGESLAAEPGYLDVVDGIGREDLSFGYDKDGEPTPTKDHLEMVKYLDLFKENGKKVLTTDYVFSNSEDVPDYTEAASKITLSYEFSQSKGYVPYATVRNLNYLTINPTQTPIENSIGSFDEVSEFLYYLQPAEGLTKSDYINSIKTTNFDCVIMDYSFDGTDEFSKEEITSIKQGLNNNKGGYAIAYMSIGEAEDYRFYWNKDWTTTKGRVKTSAPDWLYKQDPNWKGNYYVLYWKKAWKNIIFSYLDQIIAQGFDGVYLDLIDAFEVYEEVLGQ